MLAPGIPVPVDIGIWPTEMHVAAGERLRLTVQGRDIYDEDRSNLAFCQHGDTRRKGHHILWTGGGYDAHLLVPLIPH